MGIEMSALVASSVYSSSGHLLGLTIVGVGVVIQMLSSHVWLEDIIHQQWDTIRRKLRTAYGNQGAGERSVNCIFVWSMCDGEGKPEIERPLRFSSSGSCVS
jgi:hypothetical protein